MDHFFEHPEGIPAVIAGLLVLAAALAVTGARRAAGRRRLLGADAPAGDGVADALLLCAAAAIGLALCAPLLGTREVPIDADGIDVVLVIDASRSMDAADTPPSRMRRAARSARALLATLQPGDRAALVAFGGRGVQLVPLTPDREAIAGWLARIDSRTAPPDGSNALAGLQSALATLDLQAERRRALVLWSDGEWADGGARALATLVRRHRVRVYPVLLGHEEGASVPDHGTVVLDASGQPAITRRTVEPARALAEATGGELVLADRWGRVDDERLAVAVRGATAVGAPHAAPDARPTETRRVPAVWPFAVLAFVSWALEGPVRDRRSWSRSPRRSSSGASRIELWGLGRAEREARRSLGRAVREARRTRGGGGARRSSPRPRSLVVFAACAPLIVLGAAAPARDAGDTAAHWLREGARAVDAGDDDAARRAFEAAAATALRPELAGTAFYQLGVWHLKHDDPASALPLLLESLRLDPRKRDAVFNLEWTQLALAARARLDAAPMPPVQPNEEEREPVADETSNAPEPDAEPGSREHPREETPEAGPRAQIRPKPGGAETRGPNPEAGADGRPQLDDETLSWWLDLVEDDPARGQRSDRMRGRGPKRSGPPW